MVKARTSLDKVVVTADGEGVVSHAGSALLVALADKVGLTAALSDAMAATRERVSAHDPGVVLRDLAVMLADGGTGLSALGALRDREGLFGAVASDSTAYRVIDSIDKAGLERLREAVAVARARAWELGAAPERVVLDFDATLIEAFSRKQRAAGTFHAGLRPSSAAVLPRRVAGGAGRGAARRQRRLEHRRRSHDRRRPRARAAARRRA
jgi:DDE family transposase